MFCYPANTGVSIRLLHGGFIPDSGTGKAASLLNVEAYVVFRHLKSNEGRKYIFRPSAVHFEWRYDSILNYCDRFSHV